MFQSPIQLSRSIYVSIKILDQFRCILNRLLIQSLQFPTHRNTFLDFLRPDHHIAEAFGTSDQLHESSETTVKGSARRRQQAAVETDGPDAFFNLHHIEIREEQGDDPGVEGACLQMAGRFMIHRI